jgi:glycosyltransferase involved in cell wall biosynthesis
VRVCIVGGIYDKPAEYRDRHAHTPETALASGLRAAGVEVVTAGHQSYVPSPDHDIVHVHHIARGALRAASASARSAFFFTGHSGPMLAGYEKSRVMRASFRYVVRSADGVIACSQVEREYLSRLAADPRRVHVIVNGIESDLFTPPAVRTAVGPPFRLLYVGQLVPLKGVDVLFRALALLPESLPVQLEIASQVPALESEHRRLVNELGIADRVKFVGFVSTSDLGGLYGRADLFVLPSRAESRPSTIAEALLSGTPVVSTTVGGIPEQLAGGLGICVPPGDAQALAAALTRALTDLPELRARVAAARPRLVAELDIARMVRSHIDVYQAALAARTSRRARPSLIDPAVRLALAMRNG